MWKCVTEIHTLVQKGEKKVIFQNKLQIADIFDSVFWRSPVATPCNSSPPPPETTSASILGDTHITSNFSPRWRICRGHDMPIRGPLAIWQSSLCSEIIHFSQSWCKRRAMFANPPPKKTKNGNRLVTCHRVWLEHLAGRAGSTAGILSLPPLTFASAFTAGLNPQCSSFCDVLFGAAT